MYFQVAQLLLRFDCLVTRGLIFRYNLFIIRVWTPHLSPMARPEPPIFLPFSDTSASMAIIKNCAHTSCKFIRARALLLVGTGKILLATQAESGISANQYYRWGLGCQHIQRTC